MFLILLHHLVVFVLIVRLVAKLLVLFSGTNDAEPSVSSRHSTRNWKRIKLRNQLMQQTLNNCQ